MDNKRPISWEQAVEWLRKQTDQQELVRACYYDDPLLEAAKRFAASAEWKATLALLPKPAGSALDLGAGRGISSYALAVAGWQVTALEPDPSDLVGTGAIRALVQESGLPIFIAQGIAEEMDFGTGVFDLVYTREVLHHAHDLNAMLRSVARALKPGGMFIACREHAIRREDDLQTFLENHPLHRFYGGENAFLLSVYRSAIRASGLRITKTYGQYETVINYFPRTESEIHQTLCAPIRKRVGRLADLLCQPRCFLSRWVMRILAYVFSHFSRTPGILYTFIAIKPQ
jgi:2-polyprenyl-3-methyl-5-hydroxy-6-metoxy-1,4-benzoquinol methylase